MPLPAPPLPPAETVRSDLAALCEWWKLAGVDYTFTEQPGAWLDPVPHADGGFGRGEAGSTTISVQPNHAPAAKVTTDAESTSGLGGRIGGERSTWPTDLAHFQQWWMEEPSLAEYGAFPRILPRGPHQPAIMLFVFEPEESDREHLLSGQQGRLARAILRAMGTDEASTYYASVLPRLTPLADWQALATRGLGAVVAHHIALVEPERVVVFGRSGANLFEDDARLFRAPGLDELLRSAQRRERFWRKWIEWSKPAA